MPFVLFWRYDFMAWLARFFLILCLAMVQVAHAGNVEQYKLAPGDLIKIQVFGEPDLDLEIRLDSTGVINYPFLGKINVSGLSLEALEHKLVAGLKKGYLLDPQLNTSIVEYRPFFVEGEVKNPGGYPYIPNLTARKAIALAGGFTEFAAKEKFMVVDAKTTQKTYVDVNAIISPDDSIVIEKSIFYIYGEVKNSGSYPLRPGLTLREAVSYSRRYFISN